MFKKKSFLGLMTLLSGLLFLSGCSNDNNSKSENEGGGVFTMSNSATGNELIQYKIDDDGSLEFKAKIKTSGLGSGTGLGSQGAVIISADKKFIFAVNAGDNSVSSFKIVSDNDPVLFIGKYNLVGKKPISITQRGNLVYVLNSEGATGASSIEGFTLNAATGILTAIPNSSTTFAVNVDPAQVSFVYDNIIVVTERGANKLASYTLSANYVPTNRQEITSQATTPFGFAVGSKGKIYVTEASAMSSVSSYMVSSTGAISNISTLRNNQGGACWAVLNKAESIVYSTNFNSHTISSFNIGTDGKLTATQIASDLGSGNGPLDAGITRSSNYFYVLAGTSGSILGYGLNGNLLTAIPGATIFVPTTSVGLAVY